MKSLKPVVRDCMAYIAVYHPMGQFSRHDIPTEYRRGLSGLKIRGHIDRVKRNDTGERIYMATERGMWYASRFMSVEMEQMRS